MRPDLPTAADVLDAWLRLRDVAVDTPVLRSDALDKLLGDRAFVKCESLQHTDAFKFRGAYNRLSRIAPGEASDGVLAYSTGNHGQAVATVGRLLSMRATLVMPADAPAVKLAKARSQGAEVVLYDRATESREAVAARLAESRRFVLMPPGDDPYVVAGQGTATLEAIESLGADGVDAFYVPCGGGGLAAGTCLALKAAGCKAEVFAAEPKGFDDTLRSLAAGRRVRNTEPSGSICDALLAPTPAELPFEINRRRLVGVPAADDAAVLEAMRFAFEELRVVVEPGGAVALASLLAEPGVLNGKSALITASGGNVDPATFSAALRR